MAKAAKKDPALTPEEKLAQALVPESEPPYPVPENWCWVTLGNITQIIGGGTPSSGNPDYYGGSIPWISPADLSNYNDMYISKGAKNITELGLEKSSARMLPKNTVCLSSRAPIGYVAIAANPLSTNQGFKSFLPSASFLPQFLYWYLKGNRELLERRASGTTFLELSGSKAATIEFPIAPIPEQQRIVDRIESLFAKLDEAKEKAQAVVDGFEDRKAAILHKAFTGELTAGWRESNNINIDSWRMKSIESFCTSLKYGTARKSENKGSVVVIRMGNLQQGEIDWTDLAYTTDETDIEKYHLEPNDVLFNRTNSAALVGKTSIYRGEYPAIYAGYLIKLDYDHDVIIGDYLNYALNTQNAKKYCNAVKTDGVNQSNINAKKIGAFVIPVPSKEEQVRIVELLKGFIEKEKQAKETAEQVIDQIEAMKKSILARAFRGELGTNDPADESAEELLKRIL